LRAARRDSGFSALPRRDALEEPPVRSSGEAAKPRPAALPKLGSTRSPPLRLAIVE
jgi:hypothetical protein